MQTYTLPQKWGKSCLKQKGTNMYCFLKYFRMKFACRCHETGPIYRLVQTATKVLGKKLQTFLNYYQLAID